MQTVCLLLFTCRMTVELVDPSNKRKTLGTVETLETPSYSRSPAGTPYSYCLDWGGSYTQPDGSTADVRVGKIYSMRVLMEAPLAAADRDAGMTPRLVPVSGDAVLLLGVL